MVKKLGFGVHRGLEIAKKKLLTWLHYGKVNFLTYWHSVIFLKQAKK